MKVGPDPPWKWGTQSRLFRVDARALSLRKAAQGNVAGWGRWRESILERWGVVSAGGERSLRATGRNWVTFGEGRDGKMMGCGCYKDS